MKSATTAPVTMTSANQIPANDAILPESKYQRRDVKDVAKLVRADIAAAVKSGALPAIKASVRIDRYSMGCSLYVTITAVPVGFLVPSVKRVRADIESPHDFTRVPMLSTAAAAVVGTIESIVAAYNRDRSDISTDYFDVAFYSHVDFDHAIVAAARLLLPIAKERLAEARGVREEAESAEPEKES